MKKLKIMAFALSCFLICAAFAGCKVTPPPPPPPGKTELQVFITARGYGSAFAEALAEAYMEENDGIYVRVLTPTPDPNDVAVSLKAGPSKNDADVYFLIHNGIFSQLSQAGYVSGYSGPAWAELSDVYNSPLEGYQESGEGILIKDFMNPDVTDMLTYKDGKQYSVSWSPGLTGLLYNKTLWDKTNKNLREASPAQAEMELPKTTKEMFALFDRISGFPTGIKGGTSSEPVFPFSYSGINNYMHYLTRTWWPQYDGKAKAFAFLEGKDDETGLYTADIYNSQGRLAAYDAARSMILQTNKYVSSKDAATEYLPAQLNFLRGKAFFNVNGDWLEREASGSFNPGEADIAFMRVPVISDIVNNPKLAAVFTGSDANKESLLVETIKYIDYTIGEGPAVSKPAFVDTHPEEYQFLRDARLIQCCEQTYLAAIPDYSAQKAEAKDFLKFMLSKKGQEIFMSKTFGTRAPLEVNAEQFEYYGKPATTVMCKSKLQLTSNWIPFSPDSNRHPMMYLSNIQTYMGDGTSMTTAFGASNPISANAYWGAEVNTYHDGRWPGLMAAAGVSNP